MYVSPHASISILTPQERIMVRFLNMHHSVKYLQLLECAYDVIIHYELWLLKLCLHVKER